VKASSVDFKRRSPRLDPGLIYQFRQGPFPLFDVTAAHRFYGALSAVTVVPFTIHVLCF